VQPARGGGDKILTSTEAAKVLKVTARRFRQLCEERRLVSARRLQRRDLWVVLESDVVALERRSAGRPQKTP